MVKMVGPLPTALFVGSRVPLMPQTTWNQAPVTVTASLKVTVRFAWLPTPVAPLAGAVLSTVGAASRDVENVKVGLAPWMLSGGSTGSTSLTWLAITVTVQVDVAGRFAVGS